MNYSKQKILQRSRELKDEITAFRRHFHMFPELSFQEKKTAEYIYRVLEEYSIPCRSGIAGTGIIGEIKGSGKNVRVIGLRAEMDALPVTENNQADYASRNTGIMHACGHDAHMAMMLGTAKILNEMREEISGTVLLIFQPGEELSPGGARLMLESGALDHPRPDLVLAQHVLPELETGRVGYRAGKYMASSDELYITVKGKGGHAALPGLTTDQIYIASQIVIKLKDEISRASETRKIPTVLGIGKIRGDGATNVIPAQVDIAGTFRTFDEEWRSDAKRLMEHITREIAGKHDVTAEIRFADGYPVLENDEKLAARAVELSSGLLGSENVEMFGLRMSSEDFAFFTQAFPSLYFRVGIRKKNEEMRMLHTAGFDIDEDSLVTGVANMCWLTLHFLQVENT